MKILVVEDEHRIAQSIKKGLEQEKFTVDICFDGSNGYDLASSEDYDLIILDLMLPGMDGLKICRLLREKNNHTPILILSAKGQLQDKISGFETGADDYVTKPFSFEELLARVRALIRRPKQTFGSTISVSDLKLDTESFEVRRNNRPIKLSGKEFTLLEYLMRNSGKILTKDQIINHVWSYDSEILPNTIEVYIRNLRNKIDYPFGSSKPLIHTVRGFGYKISAT